MRIIDKKKLLTEKGMIATRRIVLILFVAVFFAVILLYSTITYKRLKATDLGMDLVTDNITCDTGLMREMLNMRARELANVSKTLSWTFFQTPERMEWAFGYLLSFESGFKEYIMINADGYLVTNDRKTYQYSAMDIDDEINAQSTFVRRINAEGNRSFTVMGYPIYNHGEYVGSLCGLIDDSLIMDDMLFSAGGYESGILLLDKNRQTIAGKNIYSVIDSTFDNYVFKSFLFGQNKAEVILDNTKNHIEGSYRLRYKSIDNYVTVSNLGYDGGYLVCFVPTEMLSGIRNTFVVSIVIISFVFLVMFGFIFIAVFKIFEHLVRKYYEVEKYELMTRAENSVVIDYNVEQSKLRLSGCADTIFGIAPSHYDWAAPYELFEKLHKDDRNVRDGLMKAIAGNDEKYVAEFRLDAGENNYSWHRFSCLIIRNEEGKATRLVGEITFSDEALNQAREFKQQAETDLLTGLLNKVAIEKNVDEYIAANPNNAYAFLIIDLDNFKSVNDSLGHAQGDEVLREVAHKLNRIFSVNDFVGRIGGDEFAVILNIPENMIKNSNDLIRQKAESVNKQLAKLYKKGQVKVRVSASVGISVYPEHGKNFFALYKNADKALYLSKEAGKDRFTILEE